MSKFDTTPYYGTRCENCGHESHCGTRLTKPTFDNTASTEICVCSGCRCIECAGAECARCGAVTIDYKLVDVRDCWDKLRGQQCVCVDCAS
jgi:hypothetical protein